MVAVLAGATIFDVAEALGFGTASIRQGHEPPGSTVVGIAVFAAIVVALVVSAVAIKRPNRVVALFVPLLALYMLAGDFTYDTYDAPSLDRYWAGAGDHTRIYVGVVLAFVIGAGAFRFPRTAGALNLIGLPLTFVLTIAYLGH